MIVRSPFRLALALCLLAACAASKPATPPRSPADIIAGATADEWAPLDPDDTLVMEANGRRIVIALAPRFAPAHVANIRTLAHEHYWDGAAIVRVQDNYVVQWADPNEDDPAKTRPIGGAKAHLPAEFAIPARGLPITRVADPDGWAPETGFLDGMPVAADPAHDQAWIAHCYGVVGAGRDNAPDSSNGTELYAVIGEAPRRLDLNITVVGRVVKGIDALSSLPRGTGKLGFYEHKSQDVPITSIRLLADLPPAERPALGTLRTDSASFKALMEARRHTSGPWFVHSPEFSNVCGIDIPVREVPAAL